MQVEDGAPVATTVEHLDQLLISTYAAIRAQRTSSSPSAAASAPRPRGRGPSPASGRSATTALMPVDAVFIGTAAMTAKEAKTTPRSASWSRRRRLVRRAVRVSPARCAAASSGLSRLRADLHEVDNSAAAAARLIASWAPMPPSRRTATS